MRAASPQTVDRVLGVLVAVCASAVLVAIGARAGPSITTLLRLTCCERCSSSSSSSSSSSRRNSRSSSKNKQRRSRKQQQQTEDQAAANSSSNGDSDRGEDEQQEGEDEYDDGGDAYHAYAYGSRSGTATAASASAAAAAAAAVRNLQGAGAGAGGGGSVLHVGSCHCGGLAFEVEAPEHLVAIEGPSKLRYPFITVPAEHFRLTSDDSNGSLYLLKCRPPMGRDSTPKVSAHFFCRRCGVHVVHAPDFPHAAVADVNVHCIHPTTIKSLAVAFLRGGGVELPGMGDPVEGMFEVGRETWSDAMRERVSVALQQEPFGQTSNTSSSRALSPRRRSASVASASTGAGAASTTTRGLHNSGGVRGRRGEGATGTRFAGGEMAPFGAASDRRAPDVSTLRRNAEERERARQQAGSSSSRRSPPAGGSARGGPAAGNSWGEVLMHVASLPSSSSAAAAGSIRQHKARSASSASTTTTNNNNNDDGNGGAWRGRASESIRHAEGDRYLAGSGGSSGGEDVGSELSTTDASGKVASGAGGGGGGGVEVGAAGSRQRRSMSVDSSSLPHSAISSPGAEGVTSGDGVEEASGGGRSSAGGGGGAKDDGSRVDSGGGGDGTENRAMGEGVRASGVGGVKGGVADAGYRSSIEGERDLFVRPPPSGGVSGGYAAAQA